MTIVDLADFTSYVGSEIVANQTQLASALSAAELAVQHHCHRPFSAALTVAAVRTFDDHTSTVLQIDEFTDTAGLVVTNNGVAVAAVDYQLEPLNGLVYGLEAPYTQIRLLTGTWTDPVTVTALWGWVPVDVQEAVRVLGKDIAGLRDARFGVAGFGDFGVVRMRENPQVLALLAPHVRWDRAGVA